MYSSLITACTFTSNHGSRGGAVSVALAFDISYANSSLESGLISFCTFTSNHGKAFSLTMWKVNNTSVDIGSVHVIFYTFIDNSCNYLGAALIITKLRGSSPIAQTISHFTLLHSSIKNATSNGIYLLGINNATFVHSTFTHNNNIILLYYSTVTFLGRNLFNINSRPMFAFNSKITFKGQTIFSNSYRVSAICADQSQIHFNSPEGITITNNTASLGGGIYLRESTMTVSHSVEISQNTANYCGGIYALSTIEFISEIKERIMITNNNASQSGGGSYLCNSFNHQNISFLG